MILDPELAAFTGGEAYKEQVKYVCSYLFTGEDIDPEDLRCSSPSDYLDHKPQVLGVEKGLHEKINDFYKQWRSIDSRSALAKDPFTIRMSMLQTFDKPEFVNRVDTALSYFYKFDGSILFDILSNFLQDSIIDDFLHFDVYMKGALNAYLLSRACLSSGFLQAGNNVSEVSFKLEDESKKLEIGKTIQEHSSGEKPIAGSVLGHICSPLIWILDDNKRLNKAQTKAANPEISMSDNGLLNSLSLFGPLSLSIVAQIKWTELKKLNPINVTMDPLTRRNNLWKSIKANYPTLKVKEPVLLIVTRRSTNT